MNDYPKVTIQTSEHVTVEAVSPLTPSERAMLHNLIDQFDAATHDAEPAQPPRRRGGRPRKVTQQP